MKEGEPMLEIKEAERSEITKVACPDCHERVARIGIRKDSKIEGLTFKCRRCGKLWEVKTE